MHDACVIALEDIIENGLCLFLNAASNGRGEIDGWSGKASAAFFPPIIGFFLLLILFLMHATEYATVGRKVAAENGLSVPEGLAQCLAFGFTWWLPIKKS